MTLDLEWLVLPVAVFFAGMGAFALLWPKRVVALFGTTSLSVDGRNEVRAVYGGFGLAVAGLLLWVSARPVLGAPALLAVAVALLGMALGRLVSRIVDGAAGFYPWLFFAVELLLAGMLLLAWSQAWHTD